MSFTPSTDACFALVDCNNFYVSCERLFRPDLWKRPVVVLSNNDGCVIARSAEVKALGIPMGVPYHEVMPLLRRHRGVVFSSNFPLYADLSARVMEVLARFGPDLEIYSIDEAFLSLSGLGLEKRRVGSEVKKCLWRWVGLPVSVGIGPTKTLAKLANYWAKKASPTGVVDLTDPGLQKEVLSQVPVAEVWGIGRRLAAQLVELGIATAWQLRGADPGQMQSHFNILVAQTVMELQGIVCQQLQIAPPPRKQIRCSRSFRPKLTQLPDLHSALSEFCCRAAEKLRRQESLAQIVSVFLCSDLYDKTLPGYQPVRATALRSPSQDSREIFKAAAALLKSAYRAGYHYQKCGVLLGGIVPANFQGMQSQFFAKESAKGERRSQALMATLDKINHRFSQRLCLGASLAYRQSRFQGRQLSPRYTTCWHELPVVKA